MFLQFMQQQKYHIPFCLIQEQIQPLGRCTGHIVLVQVNMVYIHNNGVDILH